MTRSYKTAKGDRNQLLSYIKRANELWRYSSEAFQNQDHDACAVNAIHSCISLADAACIMHSGSRYAGTSHEEAVQYFHDLGYNDEGFKKACRRLGQMIGEKTTAEYGGQNLSANDAKAIHKNGEHFRDYLFKTILKDFF